MPETERRRLKVLISAYACEPGKGSEPGIGWHWVQQIARFHEVWAITRANNRAPIEAALAARPLPGVHWVYYDLPRWARFWKKGGRGVQLYYALWQIGIYFLARRLHRQERFDLAHHVTFVKYWAPSFLALLPIPFVWGPVGGGESAPGAFYRAFSRRGRIKEHLRDVLRWLAERDPLLRLTARRARLSLATTGETAARLRRLGAQRVEVLSQVALSNEEIDVLARLPLRPGDAPLRFFSIGRFIHWKGFELGLRAFARFAREWPGEYWLVGDGPDRARLERLAGSLGVADRVRFLGWQARARTLELLAECDALVFPSLHDSGGMAVTEALAAGRPVICLDLGGPAVQVTAETGFKVPAITPEQAVDDLAAAMLRLAADPALREQMGAAARRRVQEHFTWEQKGELMAEYYEQFC